MTPKEFVQNFYDLKTDYYNECFNNASEMEVTEKIKSLNLSNEQLKIMKEVIDGVLTDVIYTILFGIDGEACIGKEQIMYKLYDEEGNELTGSGEIEAEAWEQFQNR